jgi:hypothetical protein
VDITQELRDTENALRDFISSLLSHELGSEWIDQSGVSADRVSRWRERKASEEKRQETGVVEERLLYYADFYDLKTILKKHWGRFTPTFGDWKTMEVYLSALEGLRDPDAHRRELLPHQKHLVLGIGGEIRTRIVRFRSKQETAEDYFPRFESVRDSVGNIWVPGAPNSNLRYVRGEQLLRPGDVLDFVATATDPMGGPIEYSIGVDSDPRWPWQQEGAFSVRVERRHVKRLCGISVRLRSTREYHARSEFDDEVEFVYTVLPPQGETATRHES